MIAVLSTLALAATPELPTEPGRHLLEHRVGDQTLRYTLVLPERRRKASPPVVLALHFAGHGAPWYGSGYLSGLVEPALEDLGAVLVAPDCPSARWTDEGVDDAILALLDHVIEGTGADRARVAVTGYSLGGMGAWQYALLHPDRFRAAVPMAGHPSGAAAKLTVPVYAIHGERDELIDAAPTREAVEVLRERGIEARYVGLVFTHYDVAAYVPSLKAAVPWIRERLGPEGSVRRP